MTIGQRIKQKRIEMKLSADELAKRLGKNRATVYRYENGDIENLPIDILEPIAQALNTTPAYLMGWQQIKKENDVQTDIVSRLFDDEIFKGIVEDLNKLDDTQLLSIRQMLTAFLK